MTLCDIINWIELNCMAAVFIFSSTRSRTAMDSTPLTTARAATMRFNMLAKKTRMGQKWMLEIDEVVCRNNHWITTEVIENSWKEQRRRSRNAPGIYEKVSNTHDGRGERHQCVLRGPLEKARKVAPRWVRCQSFRGVVSKIVFLDNR